MPQASRMTRLLLIATAATTALILVLAVVILLGVTESRSGIEAQNAADVAQDASDEVSACRSEYRVRIDLANIAAARAESERVDIIARILNSAIVSDDPATEAAGRELADAADDIASARARVQEVTEDYDRAVTMSRKDPNAFLVECRRLN